MAALAVLVLIMAQPARAQSGSDATAAFGSWLTSRIGAPPHGHWICPEEQAFDGVWYCTAEFTAGGRHHILAARSDASAPGGFALLADRSWVRRWSKYSLRVIAGLGTPGVAAVNSPHFDWAFLAAAADSAWQHHRKRFAVIAYDGPSGGLARFYRFTCRAHRSVIRCKNAFGDAMRYRPLGGPRLGLRGLGRARWGAPASRVEHSLGVTFDCSGGLMPGTCVCPPASELHGITLVFWAGSGLTAAFTDGPNFRTTRGIHAGARLAGVRRAYPHGRLVREGPLTGGLSRYYLYARHGRALAFVLAGRRVTSIMAFAHKRDLASELCA